MACCCACLAIAIGAVVLFVLYKVIKAKFFPPRATPYKSDWTKGTFTNLSQINDTEEVSIYVAMH